MARVSAHVVVADEIVEPVAYDCADDGADDGSKVKEPWRRD